MDASRGAGIAGAAARGAGFAGAAKSAGGEGGGASPTMSCVVAARRAIHNAAEARGARLIVKCFRANAVSSLWASSSPRAGLLAAALGHCWPKLTSEAGERGGEAEEAEA